jgi:two-component system CheB/CheR fusion protein
MIHASETALEQLNLINQELISKLDELRRSNADLAMAEEQQRLLVAELNHRVRNMLQIVIGLAHQTLRRSESLGAFEKSFMGRMQALARAFELLSHEGWSNAPIHELLFSQLGPFATEAHRCTCSGTNVVLTANCALALGLVLYELATNATKYGALSVPTGHLDVSWELQRDAQGSEDFVMFWRESGGPAVTPPQRQGFGTELLHRQLHHELSGRASMDFAPGGLQVTLAIPAANVVMAAKQETRQPAGSP